MYSTSEKLWLHHKTGFRPLYRLAHVPMRCNGRNKWLRAHGNPSVLSPFLFATWPDGGLAVHLFMTNVVYHKTMSLIITLRRTTFTSPSLHRFIILRTCDNNGCPTFPIYTSCGHRRDVLLMCAARARASTTSVTSRREMLRFVDDGLFLVHDVKLPRSGLRRHSLVGFAIVEAYKSGRAAMVKGGRSIFDGDNEEANWCLWFLP